MSDTPTQEENPDSIAAINKDIKEQPQDIQNIFEGFSKLIKEEKGRRLFMRMLRMSNQENTKPLNWSKRANAPYYRKKFADDLKLDLDKMLQDKEPIIYLYAETKLSRKSLQLKIHQSFMFLIEEMDTEDFKYRGARENIAITTEKTGIQLTWVGLHSSSRAVKVAFGDTTSLQVQKDLDDFLENGKRGTKFERASLQLNKEEVAQLEASMLDIEGIRYQVSSDRIKIMKLTEEQAALLKEVS